MGYLYVHRMVWHRTRLYDCITFFSTCLSLGASRGLTQRGQFCRLRLLPVGYSCPDLLVIPLESRSSWGILIPPGWKQRWQFGFALTIRVMLSQPDLCWTAGLLQRFHNFSVTKNPHSPTAWSADGSSRVGRGGSRSTARSSLCLHGKREGFNQFV